MVAARWGCDRARVHALIRAGKLEAIRIPSAGRFGEALRVPLAAVLAAEQEWAVLPPRATLKPPPVGRPLRHLRQHAEQSTEGVPETGGRSGG